MASSARRQRGLVGWDRPLDRLPACTVERRIIATVEMRSAVSGVHEAEVALDLCKGLSSLRVTTSA